MKLVLDASMALAWIFKRIHQKEAAHADQLLQSLIYSEAKVPALWHLEITNALLLGERRHVISEAHMMNYLHRLANLPIITDNIDPSIQRMQALALAREHSLTTYDATYLELALRTNSTLATFDAKLANATRNAGAKIFGDDD